MAGSILNRMIFWELVKVFLLSLVSLTGLFLMAGLIQQATQLGLSPMQAIVASTRTAAECLERPELGTLEAGKLADLVVVDGDPLDDIRVLQDPARIQVVMKAGVVQKELLEA